MLMMTVSVMLPMTMLALLPRLGDQHYRGAVMGTLSVLIGKAVQFVGCSAF